MRSMSLLPLRDPPTREQQQAQHLAHLQALQQQLLALTAAAGRAMVGPARGTVAGTDGATRCTVANRAAACGYRTQARAGLCMASTRKPVAPTSMCCARTCTHARQALARIEGHLPVPRWCTTLGKNASANDLAPATRRKPTQRWSRSTQEAQLQAQASTPLPGPLTHHQPARARPNMTPCASPGSICRWSFQRCAELATTWPAGKRPAPCRRADRSAPAEQVWRGAIERTGSHRLRIPGGAPTARHTALQGQPAAQPAACAVFEVRDAPGQRSLPMVLRKTQPQARHPPRSWMPLRHLLHRFPMAALRA